MNKEEHRKLGIAYFNKTWDLIDKPHKTTSEQLELLDYAHASKLHWVLSEPPILNIIRGEWMISHAYAILNMGESSLTHAQYCLEQTIQHDIKDFDLVFAYEAMARAYLVVGENEKVVHYLTLGYENVNQVGKEEDRTYCITQLDEIKNTIQG